jgi:hypothetical protein
MPPKKKHRRSGNIAPEDGLVIGESPDGKEKFTLFYGRTPVFSNFHPSKFVVQEVHFTCTEQYFHYMKAGKLDFLIPYLVR